MTRRIVKHKPTILSLEEIRSLGERTRVMFMNVPCTGTIPVDPCSTLNLHLSCLPTSPGVYGLHNLKTNKWYIGSSKNIFGRVMTHLHGMFGNSHLYYLDAMLKDQNDKETCTIADIEIRVLETWNNKHDFTLRELETLYIAAYDAINNGYNTLLPKKIRHY